MNVLILGCGTQGLVMVRDLKRCGYQVILVGEKHNYADDSRYIDKKYYCDLPPSSEEYLELIKKILKEDRIDTVIPMGDVLSEFLSRNKRELLQYVNYLMPDYVDFVRATDKNQLMALCKEKSYPHPFTINTVPEVSLIDKETLHFPLLIKPNITCGARGMTLVNGYEELCEQFPLITKEYGDCHLP